LNNNIFLNCVTRVFVHHVSLISEGHNFILPLAFGWEFSNSWYVYVIWGI